MTRQSLLAREVKVKRVKRGGVTSMTLPDLLGSLERSRSFMVDGDCVWLGQKKKKLPSLTMRM